MGDKLVKWDQLQITQKLFISLLGGQKVLQQEKTKT